MKPDRVITCDMHNYEDMSVEEINTLINKLCNLRSDKLMKRAIKHEEELYNLVCNIMDDGFVVYYDGKQIEPSDLEVRND